jgi:fluoride exporter
MIFYISMGGFIGAIVRYYVSTKLNKNYPIGTFLVNMIGSLLLGYLFGLGVSNHTYAFLGTGFCGAFTTFSTFKLESFQLIKEHRMSLSLFYFFLSYLLGILFALWGFLLAGI